MLATATKVATKTKPLNPSQLHILEMFSFCHSQQAEEDLKQVLADYYAAKVQQEADKFWDEGILDESILNEHLRTPYNYSR